MKKRLFVTKKQEYTIEAKSLLRDINENLDIVSVKGVVLYNVYDIFHCDERDIEILRTKVLSEAVTDDVLDSLDLIDVNYIAYESLPGQYDQRSDSAQACLMLLNNKQGVVIKSGRIVCLEGDIAIEEKEAIEAYLINPVEMRVKDLSVLENVEDVEVEDVEILHGFINLDEKDIKTYREQESLAMSNADIMFIEAYFRDVEKRDPSITEIKVLDTYWSDHCRHTTFETVLKSIKIEKGKFAQRIQSAYDLFLNLHEQTNESKPITLMNMGTIGGRYLKKIGKLEDMEISEEINACSIEIQVDVDGVNEDYLLMFKNETHNHPTEIEPFGGASTCIGGAIRDPLSGRSYVYQAMRISGAGDITKDMKETLPNKLSQKVISKGAAHGYSSYGNQIGLATTFVKEIYDEGFVAKRMEVGAVVGAAPKQNVVRKSPVPNDIIVLLGGDTGRDGIGGATGSSKEHNETSLSKCSSEVQKGNAPIERKLQRLFRNPKCTQLIKKANDFGAGGVSVAIGELADGIYINLDKIPTKYAGLNGTELAISESQERMACVIDPKDYDAFQQYAYEENLATVIVGKVSEEARLIMEFRGQKIVDIARSFLDTNGVRNEQDVIIETTNHEGNDPFINECQSLSENLKQPNVASQRGLIEMFDATVGKSTVLMPLGGKYQLSEQEASVQKLPVFGFTNTASILTYGYQPKLSTYSPYLGGAYSVVEALAKLVAVGASYEKARLTCQEYFERLNQDPKKWGKPTQALLGLVEAQYAFGTPAIGGKDSMSGTYRDIHVPPTLITFAITTETTNKVISSELKEAGHPLYLVKHTPNEDTTPNYEQLKANFKSLKENIDAGIVCAASTIKSGGLAEALCKMSFGNKIGVDVQVDEDVYNMQLGSFVIEATEMIEVTNFIYLGKTNEKAVICINEEQLDMEEAISLWESRHEAVYPTHVNKEQKAINTPIYAQAKQRKAKVSYERPKVIIPVFPGNNCEYDCYQAFTRTGADVEIYIFNNLTVEATKKSIQELSNRIQKAQILMIPGGFSSGDEPDGSGKFIANVLSNETVNAAIQTLLQNDGLILGICNGFQALVKSGLLPYGDIKQLNENSPTLFRNDINRHISRMAKTKITSNKSPWLSSFTPDDTHNIAMSHGEGKFVASEEVIAELFAQGQVATQYTDLDGVTTMNGEYNINGSVCAIEGITSLDGRIFGKMGHSERYEEGLFKNIDGDKLQDIFANGVAYFRK